MSHKIFKYILFSLCLSSAVSAHDEIFHHLTQSDHWPKLADGRSIIGNSHGGIDVANNGHVFVSVIGPNGGIQVYNEKGEYLKNVPNAPKDIHGFVIQADASGEEFIYGAEMSGHQIFKMRLSGERVLNIDALAQIPKKYHKPQQVNKKGWTPPPLRLTATAVNQHGELYVVDGYGLDYIHRFSADGRYLSTFAGKDAPWNFNNCHKIYIDPRYQPNRILCADRANHRLVHLTMDGQLIGNYATHLRRPSAIDFYQDYAAVAEISGRVTLLDKKGQVIQYLGTNDNRGETDKNKTPPEKWRQGVFTSPHGISFDQQGNLYISEYNKWGRILRFDLKLAE
ncbi:hypothetical protein [Gayadomonas joobiniege]|uniref:hypothetical protein n=1 Tax=Gayadomonas joobiniege TaxID=1234606 RepID=UPI0004744A74|nr:hypothetical protein [Gayadomonas joobiniege]